MSRKAANFLSRDKKMRKLVKANGVQSLQQRKDYFNILVTSIVYQQLSGAAAATIYTRLKKACGRVTPQRLSDLPVAKMRKLGLSRQKTAYLKDLSDKFVRKEIRPARFRSQSDEEIMKELVAIRGIGRWTAEMFLMFALAREDIFPSDDLGIKKAVAQLYGVDTSAKTLDNFSRRWSPYRTYASLYLWKSVDTKPPKNT